MVVPKPTIEEVVERPVIEVVKALPPPPPDPAMSISITLPFLAKVLPRPMKFSVLTVPMATPPD